MKVRIHENELKEHPDKVKRFGVFDGEICKKICFTKDEAKEIAEKWSIPHPFGFDDEHIDYTYKEICV